MNISFSPSEMRSWSTDRKILVSDPLPNPVTVPKSWSVQFLIIYLQLFQKFIRDTKERYNRKRVPTAAEPLVP